MPARDYSVWFVSIIVFVCLPFFGATPAFGKEEAALASPIAIVDWYPPLPPWLRLEPSSPKHLGFDFIFAKTTFAPSLFTPSPSPTPSPVFVPIAKPKTVEYAHQGPTPFEEWFSTYAQAYGVDSNQLKHIAKCESGYNPNAQGGPYQGMFQFHPNTWKSTRTQMGADANAELVFNPEEAIKTAAFKIAAGGAQAWANCL